MVYALAYLAEKKADEEVDAVMKNAGSFAISVAIFAGSLVFFTGSAHREAHAAGAPDIERGHDYFDQECSTCHQAIKGEGGDQGPSLIGVVGRKAGSVPGFDYSKAIKAFGKVWTPEQLNTFLADPPTVVPGTKMSINVGDAGDRADLIAFLASTKK